jgi:hypothetical protein
LGGGESGEGRRVGSRHYLTFEPPLNRP